MNPIRQTHRRSVPVMLSVLLASTCMTGCVSIYERYHLRATPAKDSSSSGADSVNYYRITIEGWTFLGASQYAAGWYDKDAVDSLFGEIGGEGKRVGVDGTGLRGAYDRQDGDWLPRSLAGEGGDGEAKGASKPAESSATKPAAKPPVAKPAAKPASTPSLQSLDGEDLTGKKLVLFLSTNADSLANQLGALATSEQIRSNLTALLLGDEVKAFQDSEVHSEASKSAGEVLATQLELFASLLESTKDPGQIRAVVRDALQVLAQSSSSFEGSSQFSDLSDALQWMLDNPSAFRGEEK